MNCISMGNKTKTVDSELPVNLPIISVSSPLAEHLPLDLEHDDGEVIGLDEAASMVGSTLVDMAECDDCSKRYPIDLTRMGEVVS